MSVDTLLYTGADTTREGPRLTGGNDRCVLRSLPCENTACREKYLGPNPDSVEPAHDFTSPQLPQECGVNHLYRNPYIPSKAERSPGEGSVSKLVATEGCITEECIIRLQVRLIRG